MRMQEMEWNRARVLILIAALALGALLVVGETEAAVKAETVLYKQGDVTLEGYLVTPGGPGTPGAKRPGVLVVHDWSGLGPYAKSRAEQLADSGYVALAVDIYGQGIRPTSPEECAKQAGIYKADRALMRARAQAGLTALLANPMVDPARVAAIGYCFGGGVALELARSGAPLAGVVSFHGTLDTPNPADAAKIKGKVLVCHGGDDPFVSPDQVAAFEKEMREAGVDWQLNVYGGAVHSFSNPKAGSDPKTGSAYNASADRRSWEAMTEFFREIFR
jgi:dienelactone hydrolase